MSSRHDVDHIVDDIDALIDEQLAAGEPRTGYSHGDPHYPRCGHCGRHWHGLPITARIAAMYAQGRYDDTYTTATDDSPIICPGSDFIGPLPDTTATLTNWIGPRSSRVVDVPAGAPTWLQDMIDHARNWFNDAVATVLEYQGRLVGEALAGTAPTIGGTCEPLTTPGITHHPDDHRRGIGMRLSAPFMLPPAPDLTGWDSTRAITDGENQ